MIRRRIEAKLPDPPSPRVLIVIFAIGWSVASVAFWNVRDLEARPFASVWPFVFGAAAIACWAFAFDPSSRRWLIWSGGLSFLGVLSRAAGVAQNIVMGTGPAGLDPAYAVIGLTVYPLFAIALLFVWDVGFGNLWREQQHRGSKWGRRPGARVDPGG